MRLKKEVGMGRTALVIVPTELYRKTLTDLVKQAAKGYKRILYVTLNDPHDVLERDFKDRGIALDKFYFIDARTAVSTPEPRPAKNCIFVSSPEALTELKIAITKGQEKHQPEITFIDSLSTLLSYLSNGVVARWAHDVITKFKGRNTSAVLLCLKRDEESYLVKDVAMFADKVIHVGMIGSKVIHLSRR